MLVSTHNPAMLYIMHSIFYDGSSLFILSFLVILALALFKWINNLEILGLLTLTMLVAERANI